MGHSVEYCLILITMGIVTTLAAVAPNGFWNYPRYNYYCEPITIPECYGIGYDKTMLAGGNKFGHTTQEEVRNDTVFQEFVRMLQNYEHAQCSIDFRLFVCGMYLPRCVNGRSLVPCKSTCKRVKDRCWVIAKTYYRVDWPEKMECDRQPYFVDSNDSCMMSIGDPAQDKPMMVMDIPRTPASASLTQNGVGVQFANCQCTCTPPPPPPPCYTP